MTQSWHDKKIRSLERSAIDYWTIVASVYLSNNIIFYSSINTILYRHACVKLKLHDCLKIVSLLSCEKFRMPSMPTDSKDLITLTVKCVRKGVSSAFWHGRSLWSSLSLSLVFLASCNKLRTKQTQVRLPRSIVAPTATFFTIISYSLNRSRYLTVC